MDTDAPSDQGTSRGWVIFAATYLALAGAANAIWGITALSKKEYFAENGLVWSNLQTWAIISLVVAGVQLTAAALLGMRWFGGVLLGIVVATCGVLANFLMFGGYPLWSSVAIVCNALVLWAVTAHSEAFTRD
jgi:hypothetical protein